MMLTKQRTDHPSNRLSRGEIHFFPDAVRVYVAGLAVEEEIDPQHGYWVRERARAEKALEVYQNGRRGGADEPEKESLADE